MNTLIIDTTNNYLVVGIAKDNEIIVETQMEVMQKQSELLLVEIEKLLKKINLKLLDINKIVVTIGPGSYTGVRIGVSLAKTLYVIHKQFFKKEIINNSKKEIEVYPISSLMAYAGVEGLNMVTIDARSNKLYLGIYDNGKALIEEKLIDVNELDDYKKRYKYDNYYNYPNPDNHNPKLASDILKLSKKVNACENVMDLTPEYKKPLNV